MPDSALSARVKDPDAYGKACGLISLYFGKTAVGVYENFYSDKKRDIILTSLSELLAEYIGEEKAKKEIGRVFGKELS